MAAALHYNIDLLEGLAAELSIELYLVLAQQ